MPLRRLIKFGVPLLSIGLVIGLLGYAAFMGTSRMVQLSGQTMGTSYTIKAKLPRYKSKKRLQKTIDNHLIRFNKVFSTYDPDSDISQFNNSEVGLIMPNQFIDMYVLGEQLYLWTYGAWDATIKPLIDLWGFSSTTEAPIVPSNQAINTAKAKVGYHLVDLHDRVLTKAHPEVTLDFSSIAKGYGVDHVARLLDDLGASAYLIEIGGELFASGKKTATTPWRVGINTPSSTSSQNDIYTVIELHDQALATSGDYRNFFEIDGVRYSHIINPKTGYPVRHQIVSASVIAPQTALADALATALMVMGTRNGLRLVNNFDNVEALIIEDKNGQLIVHRSKGFPK